MSKLQKNLSIGKIQWVKEIIFIPANDKISEIVTKLKKKKK